MSDRVLKVEDKGKGILIFQMQDRVSKNTFSPDLVDGLINAFSSIRNDPKYKVIILTGYDSYFASGGTQEALLHLSEGKGKFTDSDLYSLSMNCPIPVISAVQGHGIGGGFVMGLFADIIILSRESIYTANFMKYGFTPGMGATYILPKKLGISLSEEMMLTARTYRGEDLKNRGIPFPVLPRDEVLDYAIDVARSIAEKPRVSLVALKNHLIASMREELPRIIEQEVAMHEITFHQKEVKDNIKSLFGK